MRFLKHISGFLIIMAVTLLISSLKLSAGVKYEQTTQVTGAMIEMMKRMPLVGKKFSGDMAQALYFTSDSMRSDTFTSGNLTKTEMILLGSETFIHIDHERRTYSETTFAEMKAKLEKAMQELKNAKKGDAEVSMTPKVSVQDTGETKVINGYNTRHYILTLSMEIQDKKNSQKGTMEIVSDLWNTSEVPGFEEQQQFYSRMAEKMGAVGFYRDAAAAMSGMMQDPNMAQGMAEMKKEMGKVQGMPILTVASITMPGMPAGPVSSEAAQQQPQPDTPSVGESAKEAAKEKAAGTVNRRIGGVLGGLGGFGGFGRKKKTTEPPAEEVQAPPPAQPASEAAPPQTSSGGSAEPFMKTTTELKNIEKADISVDTFRISPGYKKVQDK